MVFKLDQSISVCVDFFNIPEVICRYIQFSNGTHLNTQDLLESVLTKSEQKRYSNLLNDVSYREQWFWARVAAKECVREWAQLNFLEELQFCDIEIVSDVRGKPEVGEEIKRMFPTSPSISLSHCASGVVAALQAQGRAVGVDFEDAATRRIGVWLKRAFNDFELKHIQTDDSMTLLSGWCAKEAAAKVFGVGIGGRWRAWQIKDFDFSKKRILIDYAGDEYEVMISLQGLQVYALCVK